MTDDYVQGTLELTRAFDGWWLPQRPLCCDDDYSQLVRRSRADALRCKHVEANPACQANMIVCDIDDEYGRAMALYEHHGMRPNFIAENPANGPCRRRPSSSPPRAWRRSPEGSRGRT